MCKSGGDRDGNNGESFGLHPGNASGTLSNLRQNVQLTFSDNYCFPPAEWQISNITSSGCGISWTGHSGGLSYIYQLKTSAEEWPGAAAFTVNDIL